MLEVDLSILKEIVFVTQSQMEAVLFSAPSERDRQASKFFGIERTTTIEKALSDRINTIQFLTPGSEDAKGLAERLRSFNLVASEHESNIVELTRPDAKTRTDELNTQLKSYAASHNALRELQRIADERKRLEAEKSKLVLENDQLGQAIVSIPIAQLRARANDESEKARKFSLRTTLIKQKGDYDVALANLGTTMRMAHELSGGQKIDLSLAFRLSACETFSSSVGLLAMDEPTVYFDDETKVHFLSVMERLKIMSQQLGMQFILITHEKSIISSFDQVIELTRESK